VVLPDQSNRSLVIEMRGAGANYLSPFLLYSNQVGCEGLELHILHWPHMDVTDLELSPIVEMRSDIS